MTEKYPASILLSNNASCYFDDEIILDKNGKQRNFCISNTVDLNKFKEAIQRDRVIGIGF